ncbi:hypothetical protein NP493_222g07015 [Ridgeia piscesae]|uniref:Uncharacterized protein n=1 Tax=Ridgeia piscesae TaxID=27915 RepID=A0AAD9P0C9_RIDPI|nr:hypothetical protein NP493_222g07015 [Ridgeia piscesae]
MRHSPDRRLINVIPPRGTWDSRRNSTTHIYTGRPKSTWMSTLLRLERLRSVALAHAVDVSPSLTNSATKCLSRPELGAGSRADVLVSPYWSGTSATHVRLELTDTVGVTVASHRHSDSGRTGGSRPV